VPIIYTVVSGLCVVKVKVVAYACCFDIILCTACLLF